jgi:uncharacterized protein (TIGR02996 family)
VSGEWCFVLTPKGSKRNTKSHNSEREPPTMKHPDWPAFLSAIVAEPADDTPRLVAADFLEENGDAERAAFIRAQIALARLEASGLGKSLEADELRKKERAFLGQLSEYPLFWGAEDCPELVQMPPTLRVEGAQRLTWCRGFVEAVRCPAAEWLRHGVAVRLRNPVRRVTLTECHAVELNSWYAGLSALRGLASVTLADANSTRSQWLAGFLPKTQVFGPDRR